MFECRALEQQRLGVISKLYGHMPEAIQNMSDADNTELLLSGLKCPKIITEWIPVLVDICVFVVQMYKTRKHVFELENVSSS